MKSVFERSKCLAKILQALFHATIDFYTNTARENLMSGAWRTHNLRGSLIFSFVACVVLF